MTHGSIGPLLDILRNLCLVLLAVELEINSNDLFFRNRDNRDSGLKEGGRTWVRLIVPKLTRNHMPL